MKTSILMDFMVDEQNSTINVTREFNAPISTVWSAWTESEILDKWWAPKPWKSQTKTMNFTKGGYRLYAMVGPNGEEQWAREDFNFISPKTNFKFLDAFCDDQGNINNEFPVMEWDVDFTETDFRTTLVNVTITYGTASDLEKILQTGFREGFTMALENLDELLNN